MKNNLTLKMVFYFWAALDLFYIARFVWINLEQGRIPVVGDIMAFYDIFPAQGVYALLFFSLSLLLNCSIIVSSFLLFTQWKSVHWLIYAQTPLRILFVIPSLSFLPWLFKTLTINIGAFLLLATIISEVLKVLSINFVRRCDATNPRKGEGNE